MANANTTRGKVTTEYGQMCLPCAQGLFSVCFILFSSFGGRYFAVCFVLGMSIFMFGMDFGGCFGVCVEFGSSWLMFLNVFFLIG